MIFLSGRGVRDRGGTKRMGHHYAVCRFWHGLALGVLSLPACLEPSGGSNLTLDFAEAVQTAAAPGVTPQPEQPPADTYYAFFATDYVFRDADGDGRVDRDANGEPIAEQAYIFEVQHFEIKTVINRGSPCFIDVEGAPFPGIHITQYAEKMKEDRGVVDPFDPNVPYNDAVDVLTAERRMELLPALQDELKAVTSMSTFRYPATTAMGECGPVSQIPHPSCMDDESNAVRLRLCKEQWAAAGPDFYEGSDKVFTLPLNGQFYGMVEGMNPINEGFVGGAGIYIDEDLTGFDHFFINWQYKDLDGDGTPDTPAGVTPSALGFAYLEGRAERISRGVISASLRNLNRPNTIRAEAAVFPNLGDDDVNF
jgi:hypothetical protein